MATLLAGRTLITKSGPAAADALQGKVVLLYFSASWCGPCHQFTPILKDFYEEIVGVGENFEIVYVPGDKSVQEMMEYYHGSHADYLALDMGDAAFIQHLNQRYQVRGIPHCIVIQPDGAVIDGDARSSVQAGPASFQRWKAAWNAGTKVAIRGLIGAAQHNGKTGTLLSFDPAKGRFTVALGGGGGTPQLAVKPGNVAVQALGLGQKVAVKGLQGAPQHNGKRGVVAGGLNPETGRYAVKVDGEENALGLKIENLELAEAAEAREAGGGGAAGAAPAPAARGGLPNVTLRNTSGRPL